MSFNEFELRDLEYSRVGASIKIVKVHINDPSLLNESCEINLVHTH